MREIKFRAWNKEKKIMCFDNEDDSEEYLDGIVLSDIGFINNRLSIPEEDDIFHEFSFRAKYDVTQYTGLKDKNGVEIYEGDILQCEIYGIAEIGLVKYSDTLAAFFLTEMGRSDTELWGCGKKVIIGNIYENPELLETSL